MHRCKTAFASLLLSSSLICNSIIASTTTFMPIHPQAVDNLRMQAGAGFHQFISKDIPTYTSFTATPLYTKTSRPDRIVQCLFGSDTVACNSTLSIVGSDYTNRTADAWYADYFGLPPDFKSNLYFEPHIEEVITDFSWFARYKKLYTTIYTSIVRSKWDLNYQEEICMSGTTGYAAGTFTPDSIPRDNLLTRATAFFTGNDAPNVSPTEYTPLQQAKMCETAQAAVRVADVHIVCGYQLVANTTHHVSTHIRTTLPTGTRPNATYLFEPLIGNGHHPELGGGFSAHWEGENPENPYETIRIDTQLDMTYLFASQQKRSFDLVNRPHSRYMLAQKLSPDVHKLTGPPGSEPIQAQFDQRLTPVANLTTCPIRVHNRLQVDFSLLFTYITAEASWGVGYGLWARSKDRIERPSCIPPNEWALVGTAHLFGYTEDSSLAVPLSATEHTATIHGKTGETEIQQNIDNPHAAYTHYNTPLQVGLATDRQIATSIQPIPLADSDIDTKSAVSYGIAHKFAFHFNRSWFPSEQYTGSLGIGAEIELGRHQSTKSTYRETIPNSALSHWRVWAKGSITFK